MSTQTLLSYGMKHIGTIRIDGDDFRFIFHDPKMLLLDGCIYAYVVGEEIVRIGSCKSTLNVRMQSWQRDVSKALRGSKSPTPQEEAATWRELLADHEGQIYARQGTIVETPVGRISVYLAEEAALIARHKPRLCRR